MTNQIEIFQADDHQSKVEVLFHGDTVWLSLIQLSDLFGRDKSVISGHLRNVFKEKELVKKASVAKNATVQIEFKKQMS
jgi:hypothetical protein